MDFYKKRKTAFVIDYIIMGFLLTIISVVVPKNILKDYPIMEICLVVLVITRDIWGASIGKMAEGLTIMTTNGKKPTISQLVIRNIPMIIFVVEILRLNQGKQRLGDVWARTEVVKNNAQ
jgi:uncharacterized RDD family membrane protein YckC